MEAPSALHYNGWSQRRTGLMSPGAAVASFPSLPFSEDPFRRAMELNLSTSSSSSSSSSCVQISVLSTRSHSIILLPASLWAGFKAIISFRCLGKPNRLALVRASGSIRSETVHRDGDIISAKDSASSSSPPPPPPPPPSSSSSSSPRAMPAPSPKSGIFPRSSRGRKPGKKLLSANASKAEAAKLSSLEIERTRAKLEQLGVEEPALFKFMEREALPDTSVDRVVSFISSLMGVARVSWSDAIVMLSKCPLILNVDAAKLKGSLDFLLEVGLKKEEASNVLVNHPCFFVYDLEEMRTSMEYLLSIGLPKEDVPIILKERPQALNAKSEDVIYTVDCMLEAEVIPKDFTRLLTKVPDLFSDVTKQNLKSRLHFFRQVGLYGGSLGKGIARRPNLLHFDLECMKQSYNYLSEFLPPNDVAKLVRRFAEVLVIDPKRKMEPMVNHLLRLGVKPTNLGKVLLRRPQLLGYTIAGLEPTLKYLEELGVTERMLGRVISISPQVLTLNCEERLKPAVEYLRSIGLVERKDMERLLARNAQLLCCSIDKNLTPKFEFFVRMGLDKEDVVKMLVLFPSMFGQSIELSLEPKFRYLLEVMKRAPKDIVDFPQYFGYSLEKRIKPRYEKLIARGVTHISLPSMLACVESDFISRYLVGEPPSRAPYNLKKAPRRSKYTD